MQSSNLYVYGMNNPIMYIDPSGEIAITTCILIGSIVVGVVAASYTAYQSHKYTGSIDWGASIMNGLSWGLLAYSLGMTAYYCYLDYCAYYGYKPVTEVKFNSGSATTGNGKMVGGAKYTGTRNKSADFVNGTKLTSHYDRHKGDFLDSKGNLMYKTESAYSKAASDFLTKKTTSTTLSFKSVDGTYFRYDTATNEFGIMSKYGGVSTYIKPVTGINYWAEQVNKYAQK